MSEAGEASSPAPQAEGEQQVVVETEPSLDALPELLVQRTNLDDEGGIIKLIGEENHIIEKRFGRFSVRSLIETAAFSNIAIEENGNIVGFAAFYDSPATALNIDGSLWQQWLHEYFTVPGDVSLRNTFILCNFLADHLYEQDVLKELLKNTFATFPNLDNILYFRPYNMGRFAPIKDFFTELTPTASNLPYGVLIALRKDHIRNLTIREARVEDHDDLVPVFEAQNADITGLYGSYYLAHLIGSQTETSRCIASEMGERAMGLMALTSDIEVHHLHKCFELEEYDCLAKGYTELVNHVQSERKRERMQRLAAEKAERRAQARKRAQEALIAARERAQQEIADARERGEEISPEEEEEKERQAEEEARELENLEDEDEEVEDTVSYELDAAAKAELDLSALEPNAFCITLFALEGSMSSRCVDFLEPAFDLFPDKEYCILTVPHAAAPMELLQYFTLIPPKASNTFDRVLYVLHRYSLPSYMLVTEIEESHHHEIKAFLTGCDNADKIFLDAIKCTPPADTPSVDWVTPRRCYVAVVEEQVVGFAILNTDVPVKLYRKFYNCDDHLDFSAYPENAYFSVHHLMLNPVFYPKKAYFFQEMMLQTKRTVGFLEQSLKMPVPQALNDFLFVRARRQRSTDPSMPMAIDEPQPTPPDPPFALFLTNRRLLAQKKTTNNNRIVVVGASDTGLSFLERLLGISAVNFSHVTLVAPEGIAISENPWISHSLQYPPKELQLLAFPLRARVVPARVVNIDRKTQIAVLNDSSRVPYDYLVMCPGLQDQTVHKFTSSHAVAGLYSPNNASEQAVLESFLSEGFVDDTSSRAIVYGDTLDALASVQALLTRGVSGDRITLVVPAVEPRWQLTSNEVHFAVRGSMSEAGVTVLPGYKLGDVESSQGALVAVRLDALPRTEEETGTPREDVVRLPAGLLISLSSRGVDSDIFHSVNNDSLVFDGRLVVNHEFQTNDPRIYGGGALVKFSRRYRQEHCLDLFSGQEMGLKLAECLLRVLAPQHIEHVSPEINPATDLPFLPVFSAPRAYCATLCGGSQYVHCTATAPKLMLPEECDPVGNGRGMSTKNEGRLTQVHVDMYGFVDSITYFGQKRLEEPWALLNLIGIPQTAFNNMIARFDQGVIPDLMDFLQASWSMMLYHDRFSDFLADLQEQLLGCADTNMLLLRIEDMLGKDNLDLKMISDGIGDESRTRVQEAVLAFLEANLDHLYMYLTKDKATTMPEK